MGLSLCSKTDLIIFWLIICILFMKEKGACVLQEHSLKSQILRAQCKVTSPMPMVLSESHRLWGPVQCPG